MTLKNTDLDLSALGLRAVNNALRGDAGRFRILNPGGAHSVAVGLDADHAVTIEGHTGYYCCGMNKSAVVHVNGNAGPGLAENMMSGEVHVHGDASQYAGATAHGGLLVIHGDAASRCGISLKGADIVVGGAVGHMSAFMAQAGRMVVCGDAGDAFGDSLYEARLYCRGAVASLGADCVEKPMETEHLEEVAGLLARAGIDADPGDFKRYGSARSLYHFKTDNVLAY